MIIKKRVNKITGQYKSYMEALSAKHMAIREGYTLSEIFEYRDGSYSVLLG